MSLRVGVVSQQWRVAIRGSGPGQLGVFYQQRAEQAAVTVPNLNGTAERVIIGVADHAGTIGAPAGGAMKVNGGELLSLALAFHICPRAGKPPSR